jgi:hypothetical protein
MVSWVLKSGGANGKPAASEGPFLDHSGFASARPGLTTFPLVVHVGSASCPSCQS